jgi:hypothetical protein
MSDDDSNSGKSHNADDEYDDSVPPVWEAIIELGASVPDEEWDRVPTDLAVNLRRYLYGE